MIGWVMVLLGLDQVDYKRVYACISICIAWVFCILTKRMNETFNHKLKQPG